MPSTRERILEHGLDLISRAGLSGLTLGTLASETGLSKSGLFAHFGSKEEVQLQLLDETAVTARKIVVEPAMHFPEGLPRLQAVVANWLGWSRTAGLSGGCPVAAGIFELDDLEGPVRERLLAMESRWREFLGSLVTEAIQTRQLRADLDIEQFVWELCGIYLSHHASVRFVRASDAKERAHRAVTGLIDRSRDQA